MQDVLEEDRKLVGEASRFLVESVVPRFVRDCIQLMVTPIDGDALTVAMHARGINMRYLGEVAALAALREDLEHLRVSGHGQKLGVWLLTRCQLACSVCV